MIFFFDRLILTYYVLSFHLQSSTSYSYSNNISSSLTWSSLFSEWEVVHELCVFSFPRPADYAHWLLQNMSLRGVEDFLLILHYLFELCCGQQYFAVIWYTCVVFADVWCSELLSVCLAEHIWYFVGAS